MKIFLISNMYPSAKSPSYGIFVRNMVEALKDLGVEFSKLSVIRGRSINKIGKLLKYIVYACQTLPHYVFGSYDLVYIHFLYTNTPMLYCMLKLFGKKKKWVVNVHGSDIIKSRGKKIDLYNAKILAYADKVIVPSSYFKELMMEQYPNTEENLYFISPSGGIDPTVFYPEENTDSTHNSPLFGFVSRIDKGKGWDTFMDALQLLHQENIDFKALFVGPGEQQDELRQRIEKDQLTQKVEFLGVVPQQNLPDIYRSLDLFIFPSLLFESLGLVGLEAMSCGIPVIGSKISGIETYLIDGQNGFLFPPGDAKALAEKIKRYLQLSSAAQIEMKNHALATSKAYEKDKVMHDLKKELEILALS